MLNSRNRTRKGSDTLRLPIPSNIESSEQYPSNGNLGFGKDPDLVKPWDYRKNK
jgi:hypothetical protein